MSALGREFLDSDEVRAALLALDIGALYRLLKRVGVTQRQIAKRTGQSQSEVCEILKGRQVVNIHVLRRIAEGLGIPRERMGLSYGETAPDSAPVEREVSEAVKRRIVLAAMMNEPFLNMRGEPITLPLPTSDPLPARLLSAHVHAIRGVTKQLVGLARYCGGQADQFAAAVERYTRWMAVPATEEVKTQLAAALAELHTEAAWACHDSGLDGTGYFTRGLELVHQAGDTYQIANTAWHAGLALVRGGHPNDALKLFQLGGFWASKATRHLAMAHDGWEPRDTFERAAMDRATATIHLNLSQLDTAEHLTTKALRTYSENHRTGRIMAALFLAEVHVRAGEPDGLTLARKAITEVSTSQSLAARRERLIPLATALEARPNTDTRELARIARQVATTRL